jgi:hypothetical protein
MGSLSAKNASEKFSCLGTFKVSVADPDHFGKPDLDQSQKPDLVPEFIDPRFRENKPKTLVFSH